MGTIFCNKYQNLTLTLELHVILANMDFSICAYIQISIHSMEENSGWNIPTYNEGRIG